MWKKIKILVISLLVTPFNVSLSMDVGDSLESALSRNTFDYRVQLKVSDLAYEIDVHYSFLLHVISMCDGSASSSKVSLLERIHKEWLSEVEKLKELERLYQNIKIIKFVLADDSDENKQGLLVVTNGKIINILWDDGIMFYDGVTINSGLRERTKED